MVPIGYGEPTGGRVAGVSNQRLFAEAAWIDHSLGVVLAQRVSFDERPRNGTRVHTWGDIVHTGLKIADEPWSQSSPASRKPGTRIFAAHTSISRKQAAIDPESKA